MSLLRDIQAAALDSKVDLATLLRKCLVLAKRLKHDELAAWLTRELNGYGSDDPLPPYRILSTQSFGHFAGPMGSGMRNAPIAKASLPQKLWSSVDESPLREPVAALQGLSASKEIHGKWSADLVALCQREYPMYPNMLLMSAWQVLSPSGVAAVIDTIRTRVLEFALAIEEQAPEAGDVPPGAAPAVSKDVVTQVFNVTINGGQSNIGTSGGPAIAAGHSVSFGTTIPEIAHADLRQALADIREQITQLDASDRAEATDALAKVETELASPDPDLTRIERQLGLLANITTVVAPYIETIGRLLAGF